MTTASDAPSSFISGHADERDTQDSTTATHLKNEARGATPSQSTHISFFSPARHKAIPRLLMSLRFHRQRTGQPGQWRFQLDTPTMIATNTMPTSTANPTRKFFYLNSSRQECLPPTPGIGNHRKRTGQPSPPSAPKPLFSAVAACTPTPPSHHVGVVGGGIDHRITPTRCEVAGGVVAHV